jgi:HlyD family secretion protein
MKKKKKRVMTILGILPVLVVAGFLFKFCFTHAEESSFQFAPIERGGIENIVSSTGTLSAVETVEVGSQVSGILEKVSVDFNDLVKKGQVLAVLDKTLFEVAVQDAEAAVARAKAKLDQANAELNRNRPLFEKGYLSEMDFLVSQTTVQTAKADMETAGAALKRAKTNLDYTVIRSPIDGTVIERTVDAGQTIAASFQAPKLFIIAKDLTRMQIEANVDESDIGQIKDNQSVRFEVQAYPDEIFTGKVRQIRLQPTTIQNVVNYTVVVDASNEKGILLPGMTATVDFLVEEKRDVLLVPNTALSFKPSEELIKKYGRQMKEKMKEKAHGQGMTGQGMNKMPDRSMGFGNGMMGGKLPDQMGLVFYLDEKGIPTSAVLVKGATDGKMTEITGSKDLKEGMKVITAYQTGQSSKAKSQHSAIFPPRPGGGPH